ncbi:hypothetical protein Tco_1360444, partial [Tanacetum coccineum]
MDYSKLYYTQPDPNNTYIQPPSEIKILEFIKTLGYDEDPKTKLIAISKMVATRLHQPWRAILSVLNRCLTGKDSSWDTVRLLILQILWGIVHSAKSDSKLHSAQDDHPITKLLSTTNGEYKFGMEVPDAMITTRISNQSGRGKGFMYYGDQVANVPKKLKKDVVPKKTRSFTIAEEAVVDELAKSISIQESCSQRRPAVEDPAVQSLLDLRKGSKASRLESLSDATLYSSSLDKPEESANEIDDADESDMDLSNDNPHGDYDDASHPVYTDAQTTLVVHIPEGNPELTSYISGASEVPLGTDKSKITRKQSKASKHGHENQKSTKAEAKEAKLQKPKALANFHLQGPILLFSK